MKNIYYIFFIFFTNLVWSQQDVAYLNYDPFFEDTIIHNHTAVKPFITNSQNRTGWNITKNENKDSYLNLFPAANAVFGSTNRSSWRNSSQLGIGLGFESKIGKKLHLRGTLIPSYGEINAEVSKTERLLQNNYSFNQNDNTFSALQPRVRMSYTPNKFFNFQVGVDQHFVGEGMRSMLLSDYSAPHPFAQIRTKIWKVEFVNLYQFFRENIGGNVRQKYASTHMLNFQATKRFQIGLFESVVFAPKDSSLNRGYEVEYLNPFLFYRPTEYSIGSQDRLLIGINLSYQLNNLMLYGQFALDEFVLNELINRSRWWANKYSGQFGLKGKVDLGRNQLRYLSEINFSRPFTYSHLSETTNYGHQGISLAHPLGANFVESFTEVNLIFENKLNLKAQFMFVQQGGMDGDNQISYGNDVYQPYTNKPFDYGYFIGGNGKLNRARISFEASIPIIKKIALSAFIRPGIEFYQSNNPPYESLFLIYGGIRTNLWNDRNFSF